MEYSYKLEEKSYMQCLHAFSNLESLHRLILWLYFYIHLAPKHPETQDYRNVMLSNYALVNTTS